MCHKNGVQHNILKHNGLKGIERMDPKPGLANSSAVDCYDFRMEGKCVACNADSSWFLELALRRAQTKRGVGRRLLRSNRGVNVGIDSTREKNAAGQETAFSLYCLNANSKFNDCDFPPSIVTTCTTSYGGSNRYDFGTPFSISVRTTFTPSCHILIRYVPGGISSME